MKYALITGAAGGIAQAVVKGIDEKGGWTIFAADYASMDETNEMTSDRVIPMHIDISDMDSVKACYEEVCKHVDHLDCVVNIAGIHTMGSLVEGDPAPTISRMLDVNTVGMIRVNNVFFPLLEKCKGRIINYSSENGWEQPQPFNTFYALTKWAVEAYTIGLRRELNFLDMKVVKIEPGSFKTKMHAQAGAGYDKIVETTTHYADVMRVFKPLMTMAFNHPAEMHYIVDCTINAMETKHPKANYKCKNLWYLGLIDPIPSWIIDPGYKIFIKAGVKILDAMGK